MPVTNSTKMVTGTLVFDQKRNTVLDGVQSGPISTWILDGCQFEPTSIWLLDGFRFGPFSIWEGTAKNVATVQTYCMLLDFVNGDQPNFDSCQRGRLVSSSISRPSSRLFLKTEMMLHITQTLAHHVFSKLGNMAIPFRPSVILLSDQVRGLAPQFLLTSNHCFVHQLNGKPRGLLHRQ